MLFDDRSSQDTDTASACAPVRKPDPEPDPEPCPATFEVVCGPLMREMTHYAITLTKDRDRAHDVVQDAMLQASRAWERWTPKVLGGNVRGAARAWLYKIVTNTAHTHYGRKQKEVHHEAEFSNEMPEHYEGREWIDSPIGDEVLSVLGRLSAEHRQVVTLHYLREMTCEEIAKELGVAKNTVFTRLSRAREFMRKALRTYAKREYRIVAR